MAQAPATPKLTRLLNTARAKITGPERASNLASLAPSERAALSLRKISNPDDQEEARGVTFLIPLVGPHHVSDWDAIVQRLADTLESFIRQDNPNWQAIVCCQQRPDMPDDPRLHYLPLDDPTPGNDKWRKLRCLSEALPDFVHEPHYVMSFDADDILRQGTISEMLTRQSLGGYLVESGLVLDAATNDIALADRPDLLAPMRKPFWKLCGSCVALYHDPTLAESTVFIAEMTQHEHRMFPYLARLAGKPLKPLNQPSVLYVLNHGENFGARRGRVGFKTRFVQRFKIRDPHVLQAIKTDFDL